MCSPEEAIGFKVYWEAMNGKRNELFTKGLDKEQVIEDAIAYIRDKIYMASFTIFGLEQSGNKGWEKVSIRNIWCKGR
ncbi:hypothetical protein CN495_07795 [Bacillus thuringiensis]|uniref:Uncharacterized protein n=1 Tax=Bacillus thuringiensis TaxID=1428 RepID=A0ABD6SCK5_BACTU|nr:hypothetical protein [Bacillus thuringiensis]PER55647.1 hypothetical protein CN495_07795 [Bacillus thuringiensis]